MKYENLEMSHVFYTTPAVLYRFFTDEKKLASAIDAEVVLPKNIGEKFFLLGGAIDGVIKELVLNEGLVWSWRCSVFGWAENHYSEVNLKFILQKEDKTLLILKHNDVPSESLSLVKAGWREYFFIPIEKCLNFHKPKITK